MPDRPRLALFEFALLGHFPHYLRLIIEHWTQARIEGRLAIVVTPQFGEAHPDVIALAAEQGGRSVEVSVIARPDADALLSADEPRTMLLRDFAAKVAPAHRHMHWRTFNKYAALLQPQQSLLMHLEPHLLPISMHQEAQGAFSGIYFKPTFHYEQLPGYDGSRADQLQKRQERFLFARVLKHPCLRKILCLDPLFAQRLATPGGKVAPLPDPIRLPEPEVPRQSAAARRALGLAADRRVLLFFGDLSRRKGLWQLLEALEKMSLDDLARLALIIAGAPSTIDRGRIEARVASLRATLPIQILTRCAYVPESELPDYFRAADIVLAPYQRHAGMSGIALLAAAYQKPLLTQTYGLLGELRGSTASGSRSIPGSRTRSPAA